MIQCYFDRICDTVFIGITALYLYHLCNFGLYYFFVYVKCAFVTKYKFVVFRDFLLEEFGCGIGVEAPASCSGAGLETLLYVSHVGSIYLVIIMSFINFDNFFMYTLCCAEVYSFSFLL